MPLPREVVLARLTARPRDKNVLDVLRSDPRTKLDDSKGRIAGAYLARFGVWQTELGKPLWGFSIRRNGLLLLDFPLTEQGVSTNDIISVSIRFA